MSPRLETNDHVVKFEKQLLIGSGSALLVGIVANTAFSAQQPVGTAWGYFAGAGAALGAAIALGVLLGFLFGMPKTLQSEERGAKDVRYLSNTNLEQISDWITKILVGIGLVQLGSASAKLSSLAAQLRPLFGQTGASGTFGVAVCLYGIIVGFLVAYLWTRARLKKILESADGEQVVTLVRDMLTEREDANTTAQSLINRQLDNQDPPNQAELNAAVAGASRDWLAELYRRAEDQRARYWSSDKPRMERTIPVFRALIACDTRKRFHRHFGSLGFVLKDQTVPDYEGAIAQLSDAIDIRGEIARGWPLYEWCRALSRIKLDPDFAAGRRSTPEAARLIRQDLTAAENGRLSQRFFRAGANQDADITAVATWMALNPA